MQQQSSSDLTALNSQDLYLDVILRPNVTTSTHVQILRNPNAPSTGKSVLFHHGMSHTSATFIPLVESIFKDPALSQKISIIILVNLPGHGKSGFPKGVAYGEIGLHDYAENLLGVLKHLKSQEVSVNAILSHSMGGTILQLAQKKLLLQGSSLYKRFNVTHSIFLSPSVPAPLRWINADSLMDAALVLLHVRKSPERGTYVHVTHFIWRILFLANFFNITFKGSPSFSETHAKGYYAIEPFRAIAELVGIPGYPRIHVGKGSFGDAHGTISRFIVNSQDKNVYTFEGRKVYRYLTGDDNDSRFTIIKRIDAVHDLYLTNPKLVIDAGAFLDL